MWSAIAGTPVGCGHRGCRDHGASQGSSSSRPVSVLAWSSHCPASRAACFSMRSRITRRVPARAEGVPEHGDLVVQVAGSLAAHAGEQRAVEVLGLGDALPGQRGADRRVLRADAAAGAGWASAGPYRRPVVQGDLPVLGQHGKNPVGCRLRHPAPPGDLRQRQHLVPVPERAASLQDEAGVPWSSIFLSGMQRGRC